MLYIAETKKYSQADLKKGWERIVFGIATRPLRALTSEHAFNAYRTYLREMIVDEIEFYSKVDRAALGKWVEKTLCNCLWWNGEVWFAELNARGGVVRDALSNYLIKQDVYLIFNDVPYR